MISKVFLRSLFSLFIALVSVDVYGDPKVYEMFKSSMDGFFQTQFKLLDSNGNEGPPVVSNFSGSPFGVVLSFHSPERDASGARIDFSVSPCSAFHVLAGHVVTSSTCLRTQPDQNGYAPLLFLAFYGSQDKKNYSLSIAKVKGVQREKPGEPGQPDVSEFVELILEDNSAISTWDSLDVNRDELDPVDMWYDLSQPTQVDIYGFDIVSDTRPDIQNKYRANNLGVFALIFNPKLKCLSSVRVPKVELIDAKDSSNFFDVDMKLPGEAVGRLFIDGCTLSHSKSYAGALISQSGDPKKVLGMYYGGLSLGDIFGRFKRASKLDALKEFESLLSEPENNLVQYTNQKGEKKGFSNANKSNGNPKEILFGLARPDPYLFLADREELGELLPVDENAYSEGIASNTGGSSRSNRARQLGNNPFVEQLKPLPKVLNPIQYTQGEATAKRRRRVGGESTSTTFSPSKDLD